MWETGTTDAKTCQKKKGGGERAQKPEAISSFFFWFGITQKERASEQY
jgi:hypothetical protein